MAVDERPDWVDRVMAQRAWDPPDGFADRIAVRAMAVLPYRPRSGARAGTRTRVLAAVAGFRDSMLARLEGSLWVLAQYRELLSR